MPIETGNSTTATGAPSSAAVAPASCSGSVTLSASTASAASSSASASGSGSTASIRLQENALRVKAKILYQLFVTEPKSLTIEKLQQCVNELESIINKTSDDHIALAQLITIEAKFFTTPQNTTQIIARLKRSIEQLNKISQATLNQQLQNVYKDILKEAREELAKLMLLSVSALQESCSNDLKIPNLDITAAKQKRAEFIEMVTQLPFEQLSSEKRRTLANHCFDLFVRFITHLQMDEPQNILLLDQAYKSLSGIPETDQIATDHQLSMRCLLYKIWIASKVNTEVAIVTATQFIEQAIAIINNHWLKPMDSNIFFVENFHLDFVDLFQIYNMAIVAYSYKAKINESKILSTYQGAIKNLLQCRDQKSFDYSKIIYFHSKLIELYLFHGNSVAAIRLLHQEFNRLINIPVLQRHYFLSQFAKFCFDTEKKFRESKDEYTATKCAFYGYKILTHLPTAMLTVEERLTLQKRPSDVVLDVTSASASASAAPGPLPETIKDLLSKAYALYETCDAFFKKSDQKAAMQKYLEFTATLNQIPLQLISSSAQSGLAAKYYNLHTQSLQYNTDPALIMTETDKISRILFGIPEAERMTRDYRILALCFYRKGLNALKRPQTKLEAIALFEQGIAMLEKVNQPSDRDLSLGGCVTFNYNISIHMYFHVIEHEMAQPQRNQQKINLYCQQAIKLCFITHKALNLKQYTLKLKFYGKIFSTLRENPQKIIAMLLEEVEHLKLTQNPFRVDFYLNLAELFEQTGKNHFSDKKYEKEAGELSAHYCALLEEIPNEKRPASTKTALDMRNSLRIGYLTVMGEHFQKIFGQPSASSSTAVAQPVAQQHNPGSNTTKAANSMSATTAAPVTTTAFRSGSGSGSGATARLNVAVGNKRGADTPTVVAPPASKRLRTDIPTPTLAAGSAGVAAVAASASASSAATKTAAAPAPQGP